jgi:hypothetical protein
MKKLPDRLPDFYRGLQPSLIILDGERSNNPEIGHIKWLIQEIHSAFADDSAVQLVPPFLIVTLSEQRIMLYTMGTRVRFDPWTLKECLDNLPAIITYGLTNNIDMDYLLENLNVKACVDRAQRSIIDREGLSLAIKEKFYYVGYNARMMMDYTLEVAKEELDQCFEVCNEETCNRYISVYHGDTQASNTLLVKIGDKLTPVSVYVLTKMAKSTPSSLIEAYKFADSQRNTHQIGWLFETEVKTRIENFPTYFDHFLQYTPGSLNKAAGFENVEEGEDSVGVTVNVPVGEVIEIVLEPSLKNKILRSRGIVEFKNIEDFAERLHELIEDMKNVQLNARNYKEGKWLFPQDWRNPFFDVALIFVHGNEVILHTYQVTVSSTHSMDGCVIQRACQILRAVYKQKIDKVIHHAVLPSLTIATRFRWKGKANLTVGSQSSSNIAALSEEEVKAQEKRIAEETRSINFSHNFVGLEERMFDVDKALQDLYSTLSPSLLNAGTVDIIEGHLYVLGGSYAQILPTHL